MTQSCLVLGQPPVSAMPPFGRLVLVICLCTACACKAGADEGGQAASAPELPADPAAVCNRDTMLEVTSQEFSCSETLYRRDPAGKGSQDKPVQSLNICAWLFDLQLPRELPAKVPALQPPLSHTLHALHTELHRAHDPAPHTALLHCSRVVLCHHAALLRAQLHAAIPQLLLC